MPGLHLSEFMLFLKKKKQITFLTYWFFNRVLLCGYGYHYELDEEST